MAEAAVGPANQLVMLYLNGGLDGLNCVVPAGSANYNAYRTARPTLYRALNAPSVAGRVGSTPVAGSGGELSFANLVVSGTGNNGDTKGFDTLWGDGLGGVGSDLAYVPGMHFLPANGSHFDATDYIFRGSLQGLATGWLGRWLDLYGSTHEPAAGDLDRLLALQADPHGCRARLFGADVVQRLSLRRRRRRLERQREPGGEPPRGDSGHDLRPDAQSVDLWTTVNVSNQLGGTAPPGANPDYPASSLSDRLKTAATLLSANLGVKVVTIDWGSFDTHGSQEAAMDPQITTLSRALAAFKNDLVARGIEQRVVTVVFTEFGRRVGENGSLGTDHGAGGPCFVMGSAVRGGLAGSHPSTTSLMNGNLGVTTDFRSVWQSVVNEWLGGDPARVLPGAPFAGISRPDGQTTLFK